MPRKELLKIYSMQNTKEVIKTHRKISKMINPKLHYKLNKDVFTIEMLK